MPSRWLRFLLLATLLNQAPACDSLAPTPASEVAGEAPPELVAAHSAGAISRLSPVRVVFVDDVAAEAAVGQALEDSPFSFEPALDGTARWTSRRELEFKPAKELESGQTWRVTVDLKKLLPQNPAARAFAFDVSAIQQSWFAELKGLESDGDAMDRQVFRGHLSLADVAAPEVVKGVLKVAHGKDPLSVEWAHDETGLNHDFTIRGIQREERESTLSLTIDGAPIGVERSEDQTITVPGLNEFVLVSSRAELTGDRFIELRFSDPLQERQDLSGLITVEGRTDIRLERDGSVVRITSTSPWSQSEIVHITGVKNKKGYALKEPADVTVSFAPMVPAVRFAGTGVILPSSANLTVPIEVVNLSAIDVEATRVYESNVPQFLQVNSLEGDRELERVGKVIWRDHVELDVPPDRYNRWVPLGLDVSKLVAANPGGLYRISLRFSRKDIVYDCDTPAWDDPPRGEAEGWDVGEAQSSFWDYWEDDTGGGGWVPWEERENPCRKGFYMGQWGHEITASRNVIVTDLALLAKAGSDGTLTVVATNLQSAAPVQGATVDVLDYQLQSIARGSTGSDGQLELKPGSRPFALVGKSGGQTSWLRLDSGAALATSHFDVSGASVHKGLRGFLYGERGVWRPGDDIYLSFILFDSNGKLPAQHPLDFELRNSRGQVVDHRTVTESKNGFYRLTTRTGADAPTGNYSARVRVGGAFFEKTLKIDTVMPNRLKIGLDFGTKLLEASDMALKSTLESRWLHGAIAKSLRADIEVSFEPKATTFPKYADYTFDDPTVTCTYEPASVWEGQLDETGKAAVEAEVPTPDCAAGLLTGKFRTRVFEPSGAFSVDQATVDVSPHERYIGIQLPKGDKARGMLLTDTKHTVKIVAVNAEGKPAGDGPVEIGLYKIDWRWWWEKGEDNLAQYASAEERQAIAKGEVNLKNGSATWDFEVKFPDWGRYMVIATDKDGTHSTGKVVYIDWPGWAGRAQKDQPGGASVLSLSADKDKVEAGKPVSLTFPLARDGRALVSLENATGVVQTAWVQGDPNSDTVTYTFTATGEMAPSIYANVTALQPYGRAKNDAPIRLYGILPLEVFDPATKLAPQIASADTFEPDTTATVTVSETNGRPMTYTLAVVDEGLLGLTRYQTPNPWSTFYQREALGVRTWDLFDLVANAYGGVLEGMLTIGGDGNRDDGKRPQAKRFKPMVHYAGPFELAAGKSAQHQVPIPQYVGEVRVMVVAGQDGAFGAAEKAVTVKKPLMVLATLPRVLGPQEEVDLPVSVFALGDKVKDVKVEVTVEGPVSVDGAKTRSLRFASPGEDMATFRLKVADALGIAKVNVTATGGGETSKQSIEIDVRHPGAPITKVLGGDLAAGKSWATDFALVGLAGTNQATLELSRVPPLNLDARLGELIRYPHGCVEQTTSAAFPQVYLSKLMDLSPAQSASVERNVKAAIEKMRSFQTSEGGLSYWPGGEPDEWASDWAGHFLLEAERAGYLLPNGMRANLVNFQRQRANRWVKEGENADLIQSYRLYTLALAGAPELGAMNRLKETRLSTTARWQLAAAYALSGHKATASELVSKADTRVAPYTELSNTYGTDQRDRALILDALTLLGDLKQAAPIVTELSAQLGADRTLSTQTLSASLVALARYAGVDGGQPLKARYTLGAGKAEELSSSKPMASAELQVEGLKSPRIKVENLGGGPLYPRLVLRGLPPVGADNEAASNGLSVTVSYLTLDGQPVDPAKLEHGWDIKARVAVKNLSGRRLDELALTQILPSGWEISGLESGSGPDYDYRDVRDDRILTYFDLDADKEVTWEVPVNASYQGRFYLAPVSVEAMYDSTLNGRAPGTWVEVGSFEGI